MTTAHSDDTAASPLTRAAVTRGVLLVLMIFCATRLVVWTATYAGAFAHFRIALGIEPPFETHLAELERQLREPASPASRHFEARIAHLAPLLNFDSYHYRQIIEHGYHGLRPDAPPTERIDRNVAFFPLYPLVCRPVARLIGVPAAMVAVSNAAALLAALIVYFWTRRRIDERTAGGAAALLLCWPTACYYSYGYAEGLTLLLLVATLALADRGRWWWAACACALATATRPTAAALVPVLMLMVAFGRSEPWSRRLPRALLAGALGCAGIAAYAGYLTYLYGSPLVYAENFRIGWVNEAARPGWGEFLLMARVCDQFKYFGRAVADFPTGLLQLANPAAWNVPLNLLILGVSFAGLRGADGRWRAALLLGPLVFLHGYIASGGASFGVAPLARYTAVAVPALVVVAVWFARPFEHRPTPGRGGAPTRVARSRSIPSPTPKGGGRAGLFAALLVLLMLLQVTWAFHFGLHEWPG